MLRAEKYGGYLFVRDIYIPFFDDFETHVFFAATAINGYVCIIDPRDFWGLLLHCRKNNIIRAIVFLGSPMQRDPCGIFGYCSATDVYDRRSELPVWRSCL